MRSQTFFVSLVLLGEVNAVRRQAGFQVLPIEVLPLRRRIVKLFGDDGVMKIRPTGQLDLFASLHEADPMRAPE
jgi:hypothetical protein